MGVLLSQKEGDVKRVVEEIDSPLRSPRMDDDKIRAYFER